MKRHWIWMTTAVAAIAAGTLLRADDTTPKPLEPAPVADLQGMSNYTWFIQNYAAVARDPDQMGISAMFQAANLMKSQPLQDQIDYFNKMLYDTKNHTVQRAIRMKLADLYDANNRSDLAMEQLQILMGEGS